VNTRLGLRFLESSFRVCQERSTRVFLRLRAKTNELAADGIVTVGDLINKMQTCSVLRGKYERIVREFLVEVSAGIRVFVCGLPQYLIELDMDFKSMFKKKN
jgi:hypothetical protein